MTMWVERLAVGGDERGRDGLIEGSVGIVVVGISTLGTVKRTSRPINAIYLCPSVSMGCVYYIEFGVEDGGARILYSMAGVSSWDLLLKSAKIVVGYKWSEIPLGLLIELKGTRLIV